MGKGPGRSKPGPLHTGEHQLISIITAIHNALPVNRLFLESLRKNTTTPYELIIVDNHSTDGSSELFRDAGATVIRNEENHCYPDSQNMGMNAASGDYFAFLNNDIYLAPHWDRYALEAMQSNGLDVIGLGSFEVIEDPIRRRRMFQRWKWLRRGKRHLGMDTPELTRLMNKLYGRRGFEAWAEQEVQLTKPHIFPGLNGSAVVTSRKIWDILGEWDVRMESSDWDLHMRVKQLSEQDADIKPPYIVPWALHHHFSRVTFHNRPEPRACTHEHLKIEQKWTDKEIALYGPHLPQDTSWRASLRKGIKKLRINVRPVDREKVDTKG